MKRTIKRKRKRERIVENGFGDTRNARQDNITLIRSTKCTKCTKCTKWRIGWIITMRWILYSCLWSLDEWLLSAALHRKNLSLISIVLKLKKAFKYNLKHYLTRKIFDSGPVASISCRGFQHRPLDQVKHKFCRSFDLQRLKQRLHICPCLICLITLWTIPQTKEFGRCEIPCLIAVANKFANLAFTRSLLNLPATSTYSRQTSAPTPSIFSRIKPGREASSSTHTVERPCSGLTLEIDNASIRSRYSNLPC